MNLLSFNILNIIYVNNLITICQNVSTSIRVLLRCICQHRIKVVISNKYQFTATDKQILVIYQWFNYKSM